MRKRNSSPGGGRSPMREIGGFGVAVLVMSLVVLLVWSPLGLAGMYFGGAVICFANYASARLGMTGHVLQAHTAALGILTCLCLSAVSFVAVLW